MENDKGRVTVGGLAKRALRESGRPTVLAFCVSSGVPNTTLWRAINKSSDMLLATALNIIEGSGGRVDVTWGDGTRSRLIRGDER